MQFSARRPFDATELAAIAAWLAANRPTGCQRGPMFQSARQRLDALWAEMRAAGLLEQAARRPPAKVLGWHAQHIAGASLTEVAREAGCSRKNVGAAFARWKLPTRSRLPAWAKAA